jgi:hypothetical protein
MDDIDMKHHWPLPLTFKIIVILNAILKKREGENTI